MTEHDFPIYTLPARFTEDWLQMGLAPEWPEDDVQVVRKTPRVVIFRASDARMGDLLSRAEVYAEWDGEEFLDNRGLVLSARAILRRFTPEERRTFRAAFHQASA